MKKECVKLWENTPGVINGAKPVEEPTVTYYSSENRKSNGAVVIFPGGGYAALAEHEGKGYAEFLNSRGIDAFVVEYRVKPYSFPFPLLDARRGVRYVRYNAEKFGINPDKIAVMGSSAGGHLAALVSTYRGELEFENSDEIDSVDYMPNFQVLAYPVINFTDLNVCHCGSVQNLVGSNDCSLYLARELDPAVIADKNTPPAFIWHTSDDGGVNVRNSLVYGGKLRDLEIPFEMHIYPNGPHGLGTAPNYPHVASWCDALIRWFEYVGFIEK